MMRSEDKDTIKSVVNLPSNKAKGKEKVKK